MACKFLPSDRKFDDYGHSYYYIIGVGPKILYFKKVYIRSHKQNGADPKALKFNKVHMGTHRRSGLLISKFAL